MDKLGLCKESAYRRIRGDVAFTIGQIMDLSLELGFSIDELATQKNDDLILYKQKALKSYEPKETFIAMFETFYESMNKQCQAKDSYTIIALNRHPILFSKNKTSRLNRMFILILNKKFVLMSIITFSD